MTIFDRKVALDRLPEGYSTYQLGRAWLHGHPDRHEPLEIADSTEQTDRFWLKLPPLPGLSKQEVAKALDSLASVTVVQGPLGAQVLQRGRVGMPNETEVGNSPIGFVCCSRFVCQVSK